MIIECNTHYTSHLWQILSNFPILTIAQFLTTFKITDNVWQLLITLRLFDKFRNFDKFLRRKNSDKIDGLWSFFQSLIDIPAARDLLWTCWHFRKLWTSIYDNHSNLIKFFEIMKTPRMLWQEKTGCVFSSMTEHNQDKNGSDSSAQSANLVFFFISAKLFPEASK